MNETISNIITINSEKFIKENFDKLYIEKISSYKYVRII